MKIRSVTLGNNLSWPLSAGELDKAGRFLGRARALFEETGIEVQTTRLATQPLRQFHAPPVELAAGIEMACKERSIDYCSLGPTHLESGALAEVLRSTSLIFASVETAHGG